jgi:hypothetical protein
MNAKSLNKDTNFQVFMKDISADKDLRPDPVEFCALGYFDP